ncbi:hypothetical protein BKA59DRAFT_446145 [Fusarium tricinctum]|uniref:Glycosyl transferase CAP10 domain-containing protein n=1 Tax=Fusarium tricinctum TaxID=61284 RepID=A0A8K0W7B0_9HYPO|nr:hypothetical protein BKA59DRAFT_446145 [Fusarium tricinctum]
MASQAVYSLCSPHMSIALALVFTAASSYYFRREDELLSEVICWACLPKIFRIYNLNHGLNAPLPIKQETRARRPHSLWAVAVCLSIMSFCRSEANCFKLIPVLIPLLILAKRRWEQRASGPEGSGIARLANSGLVASAIAAFSVITLTSRGYRGLIPSAVMTTASFVVYSAFPGDIERRSFLHFLPPFGSCISSLAPRVTGILSIGILIRVSIFGFPRSNVLNTLLLGILKALSWRFIAQSARRTSWKLAAMITTFCLLSSHDPFKSLTNGQALSYVIASLISLVQLSLSIPRHIRPKRALYISILLPLTPYLISSLAIHIHQQDTWAFDEGTPHPVEGLFNQSKNDFQRLLQRQSSSFGMACSEYRRRYGIEPPAGFQDWYEMASSSHSPLIDDFDSMYQSISPLWDLSGKEILDTMHQAQNRPGADLWLCQFLGATSTTTCTHPHRTFDRHISRLFNTLLANVTKLPDVSFLVNHIDEPRVLYQASPKTSSAQDQKVTIESHSKRPTWNLLTQNCNQSSSTIDKSKGIETFGLPFVTNISIAQDLCQHPEYNASYGLALSPVSFRPIKGMIPILSTGTLSTMGDILFPSPAYTEPEFSYDKSKDMKWGQKRDGLYWAGSTTGGFALDSNWQLFHRQRFVEVGQNLRKTNYYLRKRDGLVERVRSSFLNGRLFDVAFTRVFQCERKACRDQDAYFTIKSWADKDEALGSKLAFDIDGNGISGRYYKLLASWSVPMKQTLLREWHDDRLIPWVHYIPVSQAMDELPELVSYLTVTRSGQQIAKEIAENGRDWHGRALREVDLGVYTYRLLLEIIRLQDPLRDANTVPA